MTTNYWIHYPAAYKKQLKSLLHQQMWLFGWDILCPEGNLLYQYQFSHQHAAVRGGSMYTRWEGGGFKRLRRSKGFLWLASDNDMAYFWSQVARQGYFQIVGHWWAAKLRENWLADAEVQLEINHAWAEPYGDRRKEIACIGQKLKKETLMASLDGCLLNDAEMALWQAGQLTLENPFVAPAAEVDEACA